MLGTQLIRKLRQSGTGNVKLEVAIKVVEANPRADAREVYAAMTDYANLHQEHGYAGTLQKADEIIRTGDFTKTSFVQRNPEDVIEGYDPTEDDADGDTAAGRPRKDDTEEGGDGEDKIVPGAAVPKPSKKVPPAVRPKPPVPDISKPQNATPAALGPTKVPELDDFGKPVPEGGKIVYVDGKRVAEGPMTSPAPAAVGPKLAVPGRSPARQQQRIPAPAEVKPGDPAAGPAKPPTPAPVTGQPSDKATEGTDPKP